MEERLIKASKGKSYSQGGLNIPEFKIELTKSFPDRKVEISKSSRKQLEEIYQEFLEFPNSEKDEISELPKSRRLKNLSGPVSFIFYNNIQDKRILLLGDRHQIEDICSSDIESYEVQDWLKDLVSDTSECVDILVEDSFSEISDRTYLKYKNLRESESPLNSIRRTFRNFTAPNLRYHFIDTRIISKSIVNPYIESFMKVREDKELFKEIKQYVNNNREPLSDIIDFYLGYKQEIPDGYLNIIKGINDIRNVPTDEEKVLNYLVKSKDKFTKEFLKLSPNIDKNEFLFVIRSMYKNKIKTTSQYLLLTLFFTIDVDIYVLARLFVRFNKDKMERGPINCRNSKYQEMKNIIIYAGVAHIKNYNKFLKLYFGVSPDIEIQNETKQCIRLDEEFDFFE